MATKKKKPEYMDKDVKGAQIRLLKERNQEFRNKIMIAYKGLNRIVQGPDSWARELAIETIEKMKAKDAD